MDNLSKLYNISKKYSSHIFLATLMIIVSLITYYKVLIQIDIGPVVDTCDFLSNALIFAGQNTGYFDLTRPPFFSFLTSLFFRMGYVSPTTIFALDGILYIFGVAGLFFLLKTHFNDNLSFLGSLLYATFFTVLVYVGVGFSDIASVSFTIWAFYFLILAVKKDSKFFYLALPFAMLAFLTRYNNALLIFPILFYILINKDKIKNIKDMFAGALVSLLFLIPVFIFFYEKFGNIIYPFMSFFHTSTAPSSISFEYNPNSFFYIEKIYLFIGFEGILTVLIIAVGFFIYGILNFKKPKTEKNIIKRLNFRKKSTQLNLILFTILALIFIGSLSYVHYIISEALFFILSYLFYNLIKSLEIKDMELHLLFFAWFMTFFIFHSIYAIKDNRYFILMAPAVAYFLILGLSEISNRLTLKIKNKNVMLPALIIILTIVTIWSTALFLPLTQETNYQFKVQNEEITSSSSWLMNYDPNFKNKIIYSDLNSNFGWYLRTNVIEVPIYKDYKKYGLENHNITPADIKINDILTEGKAYYYLSNQTGLILTSYKPLKQFGNLTIYEKK